MLLVDGAMASRAVFPTNGSSLLYTNTYSDTNLWWFNYNAGDIPPNSLTNWTNMEVMVDWSFNSSTFGVSNVNTNTRQIFLTFSNWAGGGGGYPWQSIPDIQTYRVYNTVDGISQP